MVAQAYGETRDPIAARLAPALCRACCGLGYGDTVNETVTAGAGA
jgi:hypothetical protein